MLRLHCLPLTPPPCTNKPQPQPLPTGADLNLQHSVDGSTALSRAAWRGHAAVVRELITAGAALDQQDSHGLSAIAAAACAGHTAVVGQLAEAGAALDLPDCQGWTACHWAADNGHTHTVQLLAARGARLDARGAAGETAIFVAARGGHAEAALALALAGAETDSRNSAGQTPLFVAAVGGHSAAVLALVAAGATLSLLPPPLLQRAMHLLGQQCKVRGPGCNGLVGMPVMQLCGLFLAFWQWQQRPLLFGCKADSPRSCHLTLPCRHSTAGLLGPSRRAELGAVANQSHSNRMGPAARPVPPNLRY